MGPYGRNKNQNATSSTIFITFGPKVMMNNVVMGEYKAIVFDDLAKIAFLRHDHTALEISKRYSYSIYPIWPKIMINKTVIREYKSINVLVICPPK